MMKYDEVFISEKARVNFIKGLVRLAKADGNISQEESQYFIAAAHDMGIGKDGVNEINNSIMSDESIAVCFDTHLEKLLFFREGIQLCAVDDSYDDNERTEVRVMAAGMDVSETEIKKIELWVIEGMDWKKRGDEMLRDCLRAMEV